LQRRCSPRLARRKLGRVECGAVSSHRSRSAQCAPSRAARAGRPVDPARPVRTTRRVARELRMAAGEKSDVYVTAARWSADAQAECPAARLLDQLGLAQADLHLQLRSVAYQNLGCIRTAARRRRASPRPALGSAGDRKRRGLHGVRVPPTVMRAIFTVGSPRPPAPTARPCHRSKFPRTV